MMTPKWVKLQKLFLGLSLAALAAGCRRTVPQEEVIARVNASVLTKQEFAESIPVGLGEISIAGKEDIVRQWVDGELLYQEAKRLGLHKDPKMARQIKENEKVLLANYLIQKEILDKQLVDEAEARAYFDKHQEEFQTELRISQILVGSKAEADKIKEQLDQGADFQAVVRQSSRDSLSRARGGDLGGYFRRGSGSIPLEFEEAVFSLKVGEISKPIKLSDGYRIIKVTERRPISEKVKFEDVREGLLYVLNIDTKRKAYEQLVDRLKAKSKVESHPERLN